MTDLTARPVDGAPPRMSNARVVTAGVVGTVVEYFDFLIYATVSGLVFGQLFFPAGNDFVATMLVWSTFAVGFLVRPLGGILFGHLGDRLGRSRVLFVTLMMMGLATTAIGLLPTYDQIGVAAPILLILLRVVQGLGVGGEYGAAAVTVIEHTDGSGRRGLFGALTSGSSSLGFLVASGAMAGLTALTSDEQFIGWAWRVPFLFSAVLLAVGFWVRYRLGETPAMKEARDNGTVVRTPLLELLRHHRGALLVALGAPFGLMATYYVVLVFSIPFAVQQGDGDESFLLAMSTIAQAIYLGAVVLGGHLSDRFGRRLPLMIGAVGVAVWSFAFFPLLLSGATVAVLAAFVVALLFLGLVFGPMAAFLVELFGTNVRLSGMSFGYQVSAALAGGLSPLVATWLVYRSGSWVAISVMVAVTMAVTFAAVLASRNRTDVDLRS